MLLLFSIYSLRSPGPFLMNLLIMNHRAMLYSHNKTTQKIGTDRGKNQYFLYFVFVVSSIKHQLWMSSSPHIATGIRWPPQLGKRQLSEVRVSFVVCVIGGQKKCTFPQWVQGEWGRDWFTFELRNTSTTIATGGKRRPASIYCFVACMTRAYTPVVKVTSNTENAVHTSFISKQLLTFEL